MKNLKKCTVFLFAVLILIPVLLFNREEGAMSAIDNRYLAENPLTHSGEGTFSQRMEQYVSDRIGLRDRMIRTYTVLNDRLFHKMVHPIYSYGKDGMVFGEGVSVYREYTEFHEIFLNMVESIYRYCQERDVPFLFVVNPAKPAVYPEYVKDSIDYNRDWFRELIDRLEERGIPYLDNTQTLLEAKNSGEAVFNWKYDANHWNDLGAYYGVNAILRRMQEQCPHTPLIAPEELHRGTRLETSLQASDFPIHEEVPEITLDSRILDFTDRYRGELELDPAYHGMGMMVNPDRLAEGAPRALVFQGSYLNHYGVKYFQHALGEYDYIHDYQNVIRFPYYFNLFRPEYVIFELAEYTFTENYFNMEEMDAISYNRPCAQVVSEAESYRERLLEPEALHVEQGEVLTKLFWKTEEPVDSGWLLADGAEYDLEAVEGGYTVTFPTDQTGEYLLVTVTDGDAVGYHLSESRN